MEYVKFFDPKTSVYKVVPTAQAEPKKREEIKKDQDTLAR